MLARQLLCGLRLGSTPAGRFLSIRSKSAWAHVEKGPEDPILGVTVAFNKDTHPQKMNLGVGAYRDDSGKPFVLECVRKAEKKLIDTNQDHEYAPIAGVPAFTQSAVKLALGADSPVVKDKRVAVVQALSGTGALRVAGEFIARFMPNTPLYLPDPTWGNHPVIFKDSGIVTKTYRYYNSANQGLDATGFVQDIKNAPKNSIILLHACAHNPTGVDPTLDQWKQVSQACKEREHFVLFDLAYQGFASGDPEKDAAAVRLFINDGHNVGLCQSFAKNFGLYGERAGALSFVTATPGEAEAVESQLKILVRPMYSNPPVYGARLVSTILADTELTALWRKEVKGMADRIISMRQRLVDQLKKEGSTKSWTHITNQIGMFSYTGLGPEQVDAITKDWHVYLVRNGRISMAGINSKNVDYLAKAIHSVSK